MMNIIIPRNFSAQARRAGFTLEETRALMCDLVELAQEGLPFARCDWRVEAVRCTDGFWHRIKHPPHTWRGIIEFSSLNNTIQLHLVLRRTPETYQIVEAVFESVGTAKV